MEGSGQDDSIQQQPEVAGASAEKMLSQSEVNGLIGRAKAEERERARKQAQAEAQAEFQRKLEELQSQKQQAESRGEDTREIDADAIYQQVQERFNKDLQERQLKEHIEQIGNTYQSKMREGSKSYEDFDKVMADFDPSEFPQIVYLVAGMDNAADIMYELATHPQKLTTVDHLSQRSVRLAQNELRKISQSIAANKAAVAEESGADITPPLDRMQPGTNTAANGRMSVSDLRNQPWLRG